jgi:hypothetical protein
MGEIDRGHATATELALDRVPVSQVLLQLVANVGHGWYVEILWVR